MTARHESRFGANVRDATMYGIEAVVEFVEQTEGPFTTRDAQVGSRGATYSTTYRTLHDLADHGLVRQIDAPGTKPMRWLAVTADGCREP